MLIILIINRWEQFKTRRARVMALRHVHDVSPAYMHLIWSNIFISQDCLSVSYSTFTIIFRKTMQDCFTRYSRLTGTAGAVLPPTGRFDEVEV